MAIVFPIAPEAEAMYQKGRGILDKFLGNIFDPNQQTILPAFPGMGKERPQSLPQLMASMALAPTMKEQMQTGIMGMGPIPLRTYYRIQPVGKNLNHKSLSSLDEEINGLFVFDTRPSERYIKTGWLPEYYKNMELVKIKANPKHIFDVGDYEGMGLESGKGEIIERIPWNEKKGWFKK